ncbi:hypothetical protein CYMTET_31111 [Cymbomonas tetramitiformis]|uniref:Uncharacterized protein n=1 Tax=Cymbomonas tetramitiformis TaxID=36881 RepID=A0AAE0FJ02_9CHLO|nr:hypothetical protein CYMTET_31111 [Cymbomonas tetramitiformis]
MIFGEIEPLLGQVEECPDCGGERDPTGTQSEKEDHADLVKRYPVGTHVWVFCRKTDDDEAVDPPLGEECYFTSSGALKAEVPLLAGEVTVCDLSATVKKVNHRTGTVGVDEFGGKAYSALGTILKKTEVFLETKDSKEAKAFEKFFYAAFRGKKDAVLEKQPVALVVDASYIRKGAVAKAFHGKK